MSSATDVTTTHPHEALRAAARGLEQRRREAESTDEDRRLDLLGWIARCGERIALPSSTSTYRAEAAAALAVSAVELMYAAHAECARHLDQGAEVADWLLDVGEVSARQVRTMGQIARAIARGALEQAGAVIDPTWQQREREEGW